MFQEKSAALVSTLQSEGYDSENKHQPPPPASINTMAAEDVAKILAQAPTSQGAGDERKRQYNRNKINTSLFYQGYNA